MKYRLISFDLDGTFLDDEKRIPEDNMAVLRKAADRGAYIAPNSGRIFPGFPGELREADFIRYYLCGNGAVIYDKQEDRVLSRAEIDPALALHVAEYMDTLPVLYDCYQNNLGWMSEAMYNSLEDWIGNDARCRYMKSIRSPVPDLKEMIRERNLPVTKMQMHFRDLEERKRQFELVPKLFPELIATSSVDNNIELNSIESTKGKALIRLCACLGLDPACTVALGDGSNDAEMLKAAGLGIAMENSTPMLFDAADAVTGNNNDCGFARAIEKYILN